MDSIIENGPIVRCYPYSNSYELRVAVAPYGSDSDSWVSGVWDGSKMLWKHPAVPALGHDGYCHRTSMLEGGRKFYFCGNFVHGLLTPGSSEMSTLRTSENWALKGEGEGDLVIWPEGWRDSVRVDIMGWAPDGIGGWEGSGVRTLHQAMEDATCMVALSDTKMAGLVVDREYAGGCQDFQPNPRIWVSPRTYTGLKRPDYISIPLEGRLWPGAIRTWGDFVAVMLSYDPDVRSPHTWIVLIRMTDWKMRWIPVEEGRTGAEFALDNSYLYDAPFRRIPGILGRSTPYVYRYDLSRFDEIGLPSPD